LSASLAERTSQQSWRLRAKAELELRRRHGRLDTDHLRQTYRNDPVAWVRDCIKWQPGDGPAAYQNEILAALQERKRVAVRAPHGSGKTAIAAWVVLWFATTRDGDDWKAITTASAWRQLVHYLWPEIHKWARRLRIGRPPFNDRTELLSLILRLRTGEAFGVASDSADNIEGAHATHLAYIYDEAKAIPDATWNATEGAFANAGAGGSEALALAISTPAGKRGRFYQICSHQPGYEDWWTRHITVEETIAAGRVSAEWVEQRKLQWGADSGVYRNRVLAEFAEEGNVGVIPMEWLEAANARWQEWRDAGFPGSLTALGADFGEYAVGGDATTIALCYNHIKIKEVLVLSEAPSNAVLAQAVEVLTRLLQDHPGAVALPDTIGLGAGVHQMLVARRLRSRPFVASRGVDLLDEAGLYGFANARSAAWWTVREMLDPKNGLDVCIPDDDRLTGELLAPGYSVTGRAVYQVEPKLSIRRRLGRSTDLADSVVQALAGPAICDHLDSLDAGEGMLMRAPDYWARY